MLSPADVVSRILIAETFVTDPSAETDWPCFVNHVPSRPDNVVACFDTSGIIDGRTHSDKRVHQHDGVMIRLRASAYDSGYTQMRTLSDALDAMRNVSLTHESVEYCLHVFTRRGTIMSLGQSQANDRNDYFSLNGLVLITHVAIP